MNNNVDKQYLEFLEHILKNGNVKKDRTGTGTISLFDHSMRFNMDEGFPLITSKKMFTKAVIIELIWFLKGDTNIKYLVDNGCNIWNGDAYKNYSNKVKDALSVEEFIDKVKTSDDFAKQWGELGPIYGKQWRRWESFDRENFFNTDNSEDPNIHHGLFFKPVEIDQLEDLIETLKTNPDSRRMLVTAWNPGDVEDMVLPPCHFSFQCYTSEMSFEERLTRWLKSIDKSSSYGDKMTNDKLDELGFPKRKLDLKWNQRSCDVFLGIPFNIASYAFLLHLLAKEVNMIPNDLIFSGGDCHIYLNHIDVVKEQLTSQTYKLCKLNLTNNSIYDLKLEDFEISDYQSSPTLKGKLSN